MIWPLTPAPPRAEFLSSARLGRDLIIRSADRRTLFKAKHVWAIRQQLKANGRVRDLALFDCGIDAKLRGCDLVKLRVSMSRQKACFKNAPW